MSTGKNSVKLLKFAWCCMLIFSLIVVCIAAPDIADLSPTECRNFDLRIAARLDRICSDCFDLFKQPEIYTSCRKDCFGTQHFGSCIDVLTLQDEKEELLKDVVYLAGGAETDLKRNALII